MLNLPDLVPLVRAAWNEGLLETDGSIERSGFNDHLRDAVERPDDIERFNVSGLGFIEDSLVALERFDYFVEDDDAPFDVPSDFAFADDAWPEPYKNPLRDVGRNDPCPCGSGKKAKKCCLARKD